MPTPPIFNHRRQRDYDQAYEQGKDDRAAGLPFRQLYSKNELLEQCAYCAGYYDNPPPRQQQQEPTWRAA